ncbi:hypothetical protein AM588_10000104 [Phytophthora nicotianae]|uniref:Uncharacterized protein n=1 Tax=Phytophthora nicotianae TaxID=4792 RepID=A0A0W8C4T2_PHYNI|nr:hypothetical protein AM588_10000104 [Phytophthora nicotianae]
MEEDEWDDALLSEIAALETRHLQTRGQQNQTQNQSTVAATTSLSGVWSYDDEKREGKSIASGAEQQSKSSKKHRRLRVSTDNAETDSEIGSPWRQPSTPIELDGDSKYDESFAAMNESINSFDMHFSPQFVDSATQLAAVEEDSQPKECSKRRQEGSDTPTAKKQKTSSAVVESPKKTATSRSEEESEAQTEAVARAFGDQNDKKFQMSATLSLTLTSDFSPVQCVQVGPAGYRDCTVFWRSPSTSQHASIAI